MRFEVAYDNSTFVGFLMENMVEELVTAVLLTGPRRAAASWATSGARVIALITLPMSLGITLLAMVPLGMTLNSSTLIGLLLSIGRLVDDSIIDMHSIERHLRMGKSPKEAAIDGITEVQARRAGHRLHAVPGAAAARLLRRHRAVHVRGDRVDASSCPCSPRRWSSFTLAPVLAAALFRRTRGGTSAASRLQRWVLDPCQRFLERLEARYRRSLALVDPEPVRGASPDRWRSCSWAWRSIPRIGSEMMPLADVSQAFVQLEATPGTSFARTSEIAAEIERLLLKQPEVVKVSSEVGFEPGGTYFTGYSMGSVNSAFMMLTLRRFLAAGARRLAGDRRGARRGAADDPRHPPAHDQGDGQPT